MKKKLLPSYQGSLTPKQIAEGINVARGNGKRLLQDAEILFDRERYPSACALAVLSIEESGKSGILRRMATAPNDAVIEKLWREYRTHTKKNIAWIAPDMLRKGVKKFNDLHLLADPHSDHPQVLDGLKQLSIYTDRYVNTKWSVPAVEINRRMAQEIISAAAVLLGGHKVCTEREIELWAEHVGNVEDGPTGNKRILNFYKAMISEGLERTSLESGRVLGRSSRRGNFAASGPHCGGSACG